MSARKSPRHAGFLAHILAESALFRDLADRASQLKLKTEIQPLSEYLWQSTNPQREDALNSKFIQGLQHGNMDPAYFGAYMVQDSVYCYYSKQSIDTAESKATDPKMKEFLQKKSESYQKYYEELFTTWYIQDPKGIAMSKACAAYVDLEKNVAETMSALYLVVALIPCPKLWPWLGKQISDQPHNFGVYQSWVKENLDPSYDGYKKLEKIIDDGFVVGAIDKEQALRVYKGCMAGEANFFNYAWKIM